jgi:hypothetical protein
MALFSAHPDDSSGTLGRLSDPRDPDMAMDMLVDDELPEDRRREMLESIEKHPEAWRTVALHFLARQVERRAVRDILEVRPALRPATIYRIDWLRVAALVMITAGIFGAGGLYLGRGGTGLERPMVSAGGNPRVAVAPSSQQPQQGTIQYITPGLPPGFGTQEPTSLGPPMDPSDVRTTAYSEANHIVLVPEGPNNAMAYPVVPVNGKKQTIY